MVGVRTIAIVVGVVAGMLAAGSGRAQGPVDAATFDWSGVVPAGAVVRIADADGNISVAPGSGNAVQVHGSRTHVLSGGRALVFEVVKSGNDVTICARHPSGECTSEGEHGGRVRMTQVGHSPAADFTVQLPAGVKLAASTSDGRVDIRDAGADVVAKTGDGEIRVVGAAGTVDAHSGDGDITLEGVKGEVSAHTGDGHIRVTTASGPLNLTSGDGDIEVHVASLSDGQSLTAHTGDGNVTLYVPANFTGSVEATTGDGRLESDFPVTTTGRLNAHHLEGTIGNASEHAARVSVSTGDGNVLLKQE
jgi:DUF4097 and DUF4098 domain-containing protein YvlB